MDGGHRMNPSNNESNTTPIPVYEGRPPFVTVHGGVVCISQHDAAYKARRDALKKQLAAAHPDRGGSEKKFHSLSKYFKKWQLSEEKWYAHYGLTPPRHGELKLISEPTPLPPRPARSLKASTQRVYETKAYKRRMERVRAGMCFQCWQPRGENGTMRLCASCAEKHRLRWAKNKKLRHSRRPWMRPRHEAQKGERQHLGISVNKEELMIWRSIAEKHRMSISHMIRLAMRQKFGYIVPGLT